MYKEAFFMTIDLGEKRCCVCCFLELIEPIVAAMATSSTGSSERGYRNFQQGRRNDKSLFYPSNFQKEVFKR